MSAELPLGYHGLADLEHIWAASEDRGARSRTLGRSHGGRPVRLFEVGDPEARTAVVVLGGLHALEWIGVEVASMLLARFSAAPVDGVRLLAVPIVNVDGYARVESDLRAGRRRFRRGNDHGVDLNRNWPTYFRSRTIASIALPRIFSPGPRAASEPEVAAVVRALDREADGGTRIARAVSLHSIGRMVLHPYGARWKPPSDIEAHREAARAIVSRISERYRVEQTARWVPGAFAYGMEIDHLHDACGATSLLVECSKGGFRAARPSTWLSPFAWFNPENPARVADELARALDPFLRGASEQAEEHRYIRV